ncbi:coiled-coil domain-containing protein 57 isoform X3 [Lates calcarifer]|uniref:Coiled-coil domain-containing protein 57 isoform X3 n=1 Tax=Lates calcarifer TaxID=8187 RepID=A0AAJ7LSX7_LATCA|nr:coiled-coil domain-containing protein 57 isoform X3 [Lates calcarifer]
MQSDGDSGMDLEAWLASKEREWKLQAVRIHQLESSLRKAQEECSSLREHYQRLWEAFQFNLAILDERDRELERYDVITARALTVEHNRQEELSQLHMQIAKVEDQRSREAEERQEELRKSQHSAAQHKLQLDKLTCSLADEIQKQTEEYERMTWDLQRRIQDLEGELTLQRQEMTAAFDSELRQREHEFNLKMDEMHTVVLSHDLKVQVLSKETEVHCQAQLQATEALKASEEFCQQIQTQLQDKDREIKDLTSVKNYRIKELKDEVKQMETKLKQTEDDNIKKYENVVKALKQCDAQLEAQHQAHTEQLRKAEKRIVRLQKHMKVLDAQVRHIQEDQEDAMKKKDETIQRLRTEVETTQIHWEKYINHVSSNMVVKDTEIVALQERETKLKNELEWSREEMERYKQQLSAGLARERVLEQMQIQMELEWQRHCEDMKAKHSLANEQLIQDLTHARDQAKAELREREQELQDLTVLLCTINTKRDQAIQGLTPKVDSLTSEEIRRLQEQNSILRTVVTQMRKNMEDLSHPLPHLQSQPQASSLQPIQHPGALAATSITPTANGGLFLEKCAKTSDLTKLEVTVAQTESASANIMEQSALVQQLQGENQHLQQQQISNQFESIQGERSNPLIMHFRLKQAVSCITRLSRENQQLIEMGNRLRGQITTAGIQEPVQPEKDSSTEKQRHQHDQLSALEQLQYQLTTQELQYALRRRDSTVAEQHLPKTNNQDPTTRGPANPWSQVHKTTNRSEISKNKENTPPFSQSHCSVNVEPEPHSGKSELSRREVTEPDGAGVQMMVHGISAPIHSQSSTEIQQRLNPSEKPSDTTKTSRPGAHGKISKVRNYNVKD